MILVRHQVRVRLYGRTSLTNSNVCGGRRLTPYDSHQTQCIRALTDIDGIVKVVIVIDAAADDDDCCCKQLSSVNTLTTGGSEALHHSAVVQSTKLLPR